MKSPSSSLFPFDPTEGRRSTTRAAQWSTTPAEAVSLTTRPAMSELVLFSGRLLRRAFVATVLVNAGLLVLLVAALMFVVVT